MTVKLGREPWIGVGVESTPGIAVAASKYLPFVTSTFRGIHEPLNDDSAKGVREKMGGAQVGKNHGEGDIEIYADVENAAYLLYPALGTKTTTTASGESAVYQHVLTRKSSNPPRTLTIINNDTQETRKFTYATVNSLELNVADGLATISANFLSKMPTTGTGTRAITDERILAFKDYTIKFGTGATGTAALADANGNAATPVRSFKLSLNNNAEVQYLSGDTSPAQIAIGEFEVTGEYVLFYESTTERDHYETLLSGGDPVRAMVVTFTGASIGVAETEEIKIEIPNFHINEKGMDLGISGFITENPSFIADYDVDETKSIQVTITNQTSTY